MTNMILGARKRSVVFLTKLPRLVNEWLGRDIGENAKKAEILENSKINIHTKESDLEISPHGY